MRRFPAIFAATVFLATVAFAGPATASRPLERAAAVTDPIVAAAAPAIWKQFGEPSMAEPPPPSPVGRVTGFAPQTPGTIEDAYLDFGPYLISPGQDLSRLDFAIAPDNGFTLETRMFVMDAVTGEKVNGHEVHTHHAHLIALDPQARNYYRWIYGTGEEMTGGSLEARAKADPRYKHGLRYGMFTQKGERLAALSMLHNKTSEPRNVYLRVWIRYAHGTREEIKAETGEDYHTLVPQIFGGTFNVPRTGGHYFWPADLRKVAMTEDNVGGTTASPTGPARIQPGVGVTWESAWSGRIVVAGGHLHAGGTQAYLSNMGTKERPCPNRDGDRLPGTTIARSSVFGRNGVWPSEDFQMGLTQDSWRAYVRKGDVLAGNGGYMAKSYAYPDAMLFFGVYIDVSEPPPAKAGCEAALLNKPRASRQEITRTVINHPWDMYPTQHVCHGGHCDTPAPNPAPGAASTGVVHIANFAYLPGQQGMTGPAGPPVVTRGDPLTFVNEDYALGLVRHTVTTCKSPCNGTAMANYPWPDGVVESGPMGYMVEDAYVSTQSTPTWTLDTASLSPGYYAYYCRLHAFMRGGFYVE